MSGEIISVYSKVLSTENNWSKIVRVILHEFSPIIPYKVDIRSFKNGIPSHYGVVLDVDVFEKLVYHLKLNYYCIVNNQEKKRVFYLRSSSSDAYISTIDNKNHYSITLTGHDLIYIYHSRKEIIDKCFEQKKYFRFW